VRSLFPKPALQNGARRPTLAWENLPVLDRSIMEDPPTDKASRREAMAKWKAIVAEYQKPNRWRASWQLLNTIGTYLLVWYLLYLSLSISWWLTAPLAILAGGLLIRVFIIFHDCGHHSFFRSAWANDFWGFITGLLTFTPYYHWRWEHSIHHSAAGDLDRRGVGDIWTLTVEEYLQSSRGRRFAYQLARNPVILFFIAPLFLFLVRQRFPSKGAKPRELISVWTMNLAIAVMVGTLIYFFGFLPWLFIQLIVTGVAGGGGVWLFYVQHQFEDVYWERSENWDYTAAALQGSSFYKLPKILQWFSGNIGFHHIHHLSPRIPNYHLEACHRSDPLFASVPPTTLFGSLKSLRFRLWDESSGTLVSFRKARQRRAEAAAEKAKEAAGKKAGDL
jgi:omega-6 fatty acid desaturase (delta-12 desaturase)